MLLKVVECRSACAPRFCLFVFVHFRQVLASMTENCLYQLPVGDLLLRQESVANCLEHCREPSGQPSGLSLGCRSFWPHLKAQLTYCSFRNPRQNPSVYGGDAVCSVETAGGRRKVGAKEMLETQKVGSSIMYQSA